jgi:periplasmic protein TonB
MWRPVRSTTLLGMQLLLAVCSTVALEPKDKSDETAAVAPQSRPDITEPDAMTAWKLQVVGLLERSKSYPAAALGRGEEGTAHLAFTLDRQGRVTAISVVRSSGFQALDDDAFQMVMRAQPFPPPPTDLIGPQIDLNVPISYHLPPCGPISGWFQRHCWGR